MYVYIIFGSMSLHQHKHFKTCTCLHMGDCNYLNAKSYFEILSMNIHIYKLSVQMYSISPAKLYWVSLNISENISIEIINFFFIAFY